MRTLCILAMVLLTSLAPVSLDHIAVAGEGKPAEELSEAEREAMLKRADALDEQAARLGDKEAYDDAEILAREALDLRMRALGPDDVEVARGIDRVASVVHQMGRQEDVQRLRERALAIWESALGTDHLSTAKCRHNLAIALYLLGNYETARPMFERSLEVFTREHGPEHGSVAGGLQCLGLISHATGQDEAARTFLERCLAVVEGALGTEHSRVADALNNLGLVLASMGRYEEARARYERALSIREKRHGPGHSLVAASQANLAALLREMGEEDAARALLERAHATFEETLGAEHPWVAGSLRRLGSLHQEGGRYREAQDAYERSIRILESVYGPEHPRVASSLSRLSSLLESVGKPQEALAVSMRALRIADRRLREQFAGLTPVARRTLASSMRPYLDRVLRLSPLLRAPAYDAVLRYKGLVTRASAAERRLGRRAGTEALARVAALRAAERRLSGFAGSMPPLYQKERKTRWQQAYAKAAAERETLALDLARDFAPLREGQERLDLTLADVQSELGEADVLLDFLRTDDRYLAWIVRADGAAEQIDLGEADAIETAATEFTEQVVLSREDAPWIAAGKAFRALVWMPIEKRLGTGVRTLYLCPDAALAAVPFAAMPGKTDGHLLIDDFLLVNVSMAQDLVPWPEESEPKSGALLLGGVDYTRAAEDERGIAERPHDALVAADRAPRGGLFLPLPATRDEVDSIKTRIGEDSVTLLGTSATESRFRTATKGKRLLHLATHGFVRDDLMRGLTRRKEEREWLGAGMERQLAQGHDPMLLAGLALAGANPREGGQGDDGILTALEASLLDLDGVDLVTLSACETALGQAESGEGVIGLVQGFQMAGARRVLGSLWRVDDEATRLLMERLYGAMLRTESPLSPAQALRAAALHLRALEDRNGRSFAHPRYWAAFVAYGR